MTIAAVSKKLNEKDFVAVPRNAYDEFLAWQKERKSVNVYKLTASEKKMLAKARKNFAKGEYITLKKLQDELGIGD